MKWGETIVGFCAVLPQPTGTANYCKRVTRLVILPDFQGLGVGSRFLDAICDMYVQQGYKVYIRTAHIKLGHYLSKNAKWRATARNGKKGAFSNGRINYRKSDQSVHSVNRDCYSFEYVGAEFATKPHKEIVVDDIGRIDMDAMKKYLSALKQMNYLTVVQFSLTPRSMSSAATWAFGPNFSTSMGSCPRSMLARRRLSRLTRMESPGSERSPDEGSVS